MTTFLGESTTGAVHRIDLCVEFVGLPSEALHCIDTSSSEMFRATKLKMLPDCTSFSITAMTGAKLMSARIRAYAEITNISGQRAKCLNELEHFFN